jgi:hypothetical protein
MNKTALTKVYSSSKDDEGRTIATYVDGEPIEGFLEVRKEGTQLVNDKYTPLYKEFFICELPITAKEKDRLIIDSVEYEIDYKDDISNQGEVLELGLNRIG